MSAFWVSDASSVAYLDLSVPEFCPGNKPKRLVSILNLGPVSKPIVPNGPFVRIFRTTERMNVLKAAESATVFRDFRRKILETFAVNGEMITARFYLKLLKAYNYDYVEESLYLTSTGGAAVTDTVSSQPLRDKILEPLRLVAIREFVKVLFDKDYPDSDVVSDFFHMVCTSWQVAAYLFLETDPAVTKYILHHLRKANRFITTVQTKEFFLKKEIQKLIRRRPGNVLVLLNYGFQNIYQQPNYYILLSFISEDHLLEMSLHLRQIRKALFQSIILSLVHCKQIGRREAFIFEIFFLFVYWDDEQFASYFQSLCYIWRSIPYPCISFAEMRHTLHRFIDIDNDELVHDVCHEFQKRGFGNFPAMPELKNSMPCSKETLEYILNRNPQLLQDPEDGLLQESLALNSFRCAVKDASTQNSQLIEPESAFDNVARMIQDAVRSALSHYSRLAEEHENAFPQLMLPRNYTQDIVRDLLTRNSWLPDEDGIFQPRSLLHYTRCTIRDELSRNSVLPKGLELLDLPSQLKSYMRLEL
ncbi:uncharacterized protein LOC118187766 [Stegodyphus dumicola]|uniref:uncharacterized protein LOC118187766 n=1 Tax=Stegodyphus dumicola TaxID=202533 RepID=UPI0015A902A3|nr:uncharacterized protein LOC118187766 [Stegodyphus dumicola]